MANRKCHNPFAFIPMAVSFFIVVVYIAVAIPLVWLHEVVPAAPSNPTPYTGVNTTEAWLDLAELTNGYHPYNSRRNDEVHEFLLRRIEEILQENEKLSIDHNGGTDAWKQSQKSSPAVTVFNDMESNVSCSTLGSIGSEGQGRLPGLSTYFEGTNIMVYIRGSEDQEGEWWTKQERALKTHGRGGVLVNAHYDSVSTGYGATDDGVGVVTVLQLIKYFTTPGKQPKKGIVALLNNGEEDFLNGARAYTQHPLSKFAYTFLNLEGAGAGGRATLFRSTDAEVTGAYGKSPHPFGTVIGADGFKLGLIRSGTDYQVFEDTLGLRGLDVAFWYPRARYHTDQDDAKHTSIGSLWHMLSAAVATMESLTSDTSDTFTGPRSDGESGKVKNGRPTEAVWFDLFGIVFPVFPLRGLFAWSLTLLISSPLILILISYLLIRSDKFYFFSAYPPAQGDGVRVSLYGWRGFTRFPVAVVISSALTIGSAFLVRKINPLIVYSSYYAVWIMMLTLFFTSFWFVMKGADFVRPSALHRGYTLLWMFLIGWAILVATTVFEDRFGIASGYIFVFYESAIFLATLISFVELFALITKDNYAKFSATEQDNRDGAEALPDSEALIAPAADEHEDVEEASETTPLFGADNSRVPKHRGRGTFANYARSVSGADDAGDQSGGQFPPYGDEQGWSGKLPSWTWFIQFLLIGPFILILIGQVALYLVAAISQTGPDGSSLMAPLAIMAIFTVLLLLPIGPFAHRFSYHVPTFLFLVFIGTLLYSLLAFPFSANNRYKAYFQQTVNLETGENLVTIGGLEEYVRPIISSIPSAAGQPVTCESRTLRYGIVFCSFSGIPPKVVDNTPAGAPPEKGYHSWLNFNATLKKGSNKATFTLAGKNTRNCKIKFDRPIKDFRVHGSSIDERFPRVPETGSSEIRLWHRQWDQPWTVDVEWSPTEGKAEGEEGMEGSVICMWSDDNVEGIIPALDEVRRYAPAWSAISKLADGLVEGSKAFVV